MWSGKLYLPNEPSSKHVDQLIPHPKARLVLVLDLVAQKTPHQEKKGIQKLAKLEGRSHFRQTLKSTFGKLFSRSAMHPRSRHSINGVALSLEDNLLFSLGGVPSPETLPISHLSVDGNSKTGDSLVKGELDQESPSSVSSASCKATEYKSSILPTPPVSEPNTPVCSIVPPIRVSTLVRGRDTPFPIVPVNPKRPRSLPVLPTATTDTENGPTSRDVPARRASSCTLAIGEFLGHPACPRGDDLESSSEFPRRGRPLFQRGRPLLRKPLLTPPPQLPSAPGSFNAAKGIIKTPTESSGNDDLSHIPFPLSHGVPEAKSNEVGSLESVTRRRPAPLELVYDNILFF